MRVKRIPPALALAIGFTIGFILGPAIARLLAAWH